MSLHRPEPHPIRRQGGDRADSQRCIQHQAGTSCRPGDGQMVFTHGEGRIRDGLLDVLRLDQGEIFLDLLQVPASTDQVPQVLHREPMRVIQAVA